MATGTQPRPATSEPLWFIDNLARVLVDGEVSNGTLAVVELSGRQGDMPPLHVHHREDETFVVLEGELSLFLPEPAHRPHRRRGGLRTEGRPARLPRRVGAGTLARDRDAGRVRRLRPRGRRTGRIAVATAAGTRPRPCPAQRDRRRVRHRAARPARHLSRLALSPAVSSPNARSTRCGSCRDRGRSTTASRPRGSSRAAAPARSPARRDARASRPSFPP